MREPARLKAAIDLLQAVEHGEPAQHALERWQRASRFAGAKDRAAVRERVYAVLRQKAALSWRTGSDDPRLWALMSVADEEGVGAAEALADGSAHGPQPLGDDERAVLGQPRPLEEAPAAVRANLPDWLWERFQAQFGDHAGQEADALNARAPLDLRVNALKGSREDAIARLSRAGIDAVPTPVAPFGLRVAGHPGITGTQAYRKGLVEVQDEGSQIVSHLAGARPGEQIVDLCAGGGGKALALAAAMANKGQIYVCDVDRRRLDAVKPRAKRAGVHTLQPRLLTHAAAQGDRPDPDLGDLEGRADRVVVDAPCSGTGTFRRDPGLRWRLTPEDVGAFARTQEDLLNRAARLVKPGGLLIYITCSLLEEENGARADAFLEDHPSFEAVSWQERWEGSQRPASAADGASLLLTPAVSGTDGFFAALFRRKENAETAP